MCYSEAVVRAAKLPAFAYLHKREGWQPSLRVTTAMAAEQNSTPNLLGKDLIKE